MKRNRLLLNLVPAIACAAMFGVLLNVTVANQPNVLFIAIDDLNTSPEGFDGETTVHTPNLSTLAEMGIGFTNAHCAALDIETDDMADAKVVSWAEKHLLKSYDQPLFLAVGIYRPHIPWWTPKEYFDRHPIENVVLPQVIEDDLADVPEPGIRMRKQGWHDWIVENGKWEEAVQAYNASVSFADDMVGRLLEALEKGPNAENTVIVLWTDHGYHLGQKEHWEKFALWEQTTRVPLIIAAPGKIKGGKRSSQPVSLLDIFPTLNELCDLPTIGDLDGESLVPLMNNPNRKTSRAVVITQGFQNHAIRSDKWRYIRYADGSEELYDQVKDSRNFYNLANSKQFDFVKRKLGKWIPEYNAEAHPTFNGQRAMNEKALAREAKELSESGL